MIWAGAEADQLCLASQAPHGAPQGGTKRPRTQEGKSLWRAGQVDAPTSRGHGRAANQTPGLQSVFRDF
jgi:hypothetical protein